MTTHDDPPAVTFAGDRMQVLFDRFDLPTYRLFLRCRQLPESDVSYDPERETYTLTAPARFAGLVGAAVPPAAACPVELAPHLFDDQRFITAAALEAKRFAAYAQCGLGKTVLGLEWGRQVRHITRGRLLVVTLNQIIGQWQEEAERFYPDGSMRLRRLASRADMRVWMRDGDPAEAAIVNYEKFNPESPDDLRISEAQGVAAVVLDEGSRLRTQGGRQKWALLHSFDSTEYKLVLTATPAPNDLFEFASQAGFLNKFRAEDSINRFFSRDAKTQKWEIKPHARPAFFKWLATWSIYVNDPKRYGWRAGFPDVPEPDYRIEEVPATPEQLAMARKVTADKATGRQTLVLSDGLGVVERDALSQIAKGFRYQTANGKRRVKRVKSNKPAAVAGIVRRELEAGTRGIVWTVYDAETAILAKELKGTLGVAVLTGSTPDDRRERILADFKAGKVRWLITRASVVGFGLNFQFCGAMVFAGWDDSFERMYQAVRRAVRFGQTEPVRVYFPVVRELEGDTFDNVWAKQDRHVRTIAEMEDAFIDAYGLGVSA